MNPIYLLDANALFAFFQISSHEHESVFTNLKISNELRSIFLKLLLNEIEIKIPIPALSEFMFKMFNNNKIKEFNQIITEFKSRENFEFLSWDFEVLNAMGNYLAKNQTILNQYFKKHGKKIEIFDLTIYQIALLNNIKNIISKDRIFDEMYKLNRIW